MRLDPLFVDEPGEHLGVAIGRVADEATGIKIEPVAGPLDHVARGFALRLPDRRGRLDNHDRCVVQIDEIVG
ncbi:MAG: hypothetical protein AAFU49_20625 [Pseudomonadota bacterium]